MIKYCVYKFITGFLVKQLDNKSTISKTQIISRCPFTAAHIKGVLPYISLELISPVLDINN